MIHIVSCTWRCCCNHLQVQLKVWGLPPNRAWMWQASVFLGHLPPMAVDKHTTCTNEERAVWPVRRAPESGFCRWHLCFKRQGLELRRSELLVNKVSLMRWGPTPVAHPNPQAGVNRCEDVNQEIIIKLSSSSPFTTSIATTATRSRSHIKTVGKDLGSWFHLLGCRKQVKPHHTKQKAMVGASSQDSKRTSGLLWWWVAFYQDNFLAACSWRPVENLHVVYLGFLVLQTNSGYWNEDYPGSSHGQTENIAIGAQGQLFAKDPRAYWILRYCQIVHCACVEL